MTKRTKRVFSENYNTHNKVVVVVLYVNKREDERDIEEDFA